MLEFYFKIKKNIIFIPQKEYLQQTNNNFIKYADLNAISSSSLISSIKWFIASALVVSNSFDSDSLLKESTSFDSIKESDILSDEVLSGGIK